MYMSYCRFEGTRQELGSCMGVVIDHINEESQYAVSDREILMFKCLVRDFVEFLQESEILDEHGEIDETVLELVSDKMAEGHGEE